MALIPAELKWYRSLVVNDIDDSNGGDIDIDSLITSGLKNNILPDVSSDELGAGSFRYRKLWLRVEDDDDQKLGNPLFYMSLPKLGQGHISVFTGIGNDVQLASWTVSSPRKYAGMEINLDASEGDNQIRFQGVYLYSTNYLQTGDTVVILKRGQYEEIHENVTVLHNGALSYVTLEAGDTLTRDYEIGDIIAPAFYLGKDIEVEFNDQTELTGGSFDWNLLEPDFLGAVNTTWLITMQEGTVFVAESPDEGIFYGDQAVDFAPVNPNAGGRPYFIIRTDAWNGFNTGNWISFTQVMPIASIWVCEQVHSQVDPSYYNPFAIGIIGG